MCLTWCVGMFGTSNTLFFGRCEPFPKKWNMRNKRRWMPTGTGGSVFRFQNEKVERTGPIGAPTHFLTHYREKWCVGDLAHHIGADGKTAISLTHLEKWKCVGYSPVTMGVLEPLTH